MNKEVVATTLSAIKSTPPVSIVGLHFLGVSLSDFTLMITAAYTLLLIFFLLRDRVYKPYKARKEQNAKTL